MNIANPSHKSTLHRLMIVGIVVYLIFQSFWPDIERMTFWGEGLCLFFFLCIFNVRTAHAAQRQIVAYMHWWILLLPLYGILATFVFWGDDYVFYYLLRCLTVFYYGVFFFIAYRWGLDVLSVLSRLRWAIAIYAVACMKAGLGIGSTIFLGIAWLGVQYTDRGVGSFWITYVMLIGVILFAGHGGAGKLTVAMLLVLPVGIYILRQWVKDYPNLLQQWLMRAVSLVIAGACVYGSMRLLADVYQVVDAGGDINRYGDLIEEDAGGDSEFADGNAIGRLIFWAHMLSRVWEHPYGIGFGTKIFGIELQRFLHFWFVNNDEMLYLLGAHNSFVGVAGRLGVVGIVVLLFIGYRVYGLLKGVVYFVPRWSQWGYEHRLVVGALSVFAIAFVQATFNCVLESPRYAAFFWFAFGLFVRISGDFLQRCTAKETV